MAFSAYKITSLFARVILVSTFCILMACGGGGGGADNPAAQQPVPSETVITGQA